MTKFTLSGSLLLAGVMILAKCYFLASEPQYQSYLPGIIEILVLVALFVWGIVDFWKQSRLANEPVRLPKSLTTILLAVACVSVVGLSFIQTVQKTALDWDAVALYDARAKFLLGGTKFSEMKTLTSFDFKNGYYYSLYPPFTSLIHFWWYKLHVPVPISVLYSILLGVLAVQIFCLMKPRLGTNWAMITTFLVIGQESLFSTSLLAYTNLPYTIFLSVGILLLHRYLIERKNWWLCFGIILVSGSQWVRFLEPSWLAVVIAFGLVSWAPLGWKKAFWSSLLLGLTSIIGYISWKYFTDVVSQKEVIFKTSPLYVFEPVVGMFTGSFLGILQSYIRMWGANLVLFVSAGFSIIIKPWDKESSADVFLFLIVVLSFFMYLAGLYFISFQFDWWPEMGGSLLRSSTFLLPLAIYLLVKTVKNLLRR